VLEPDDAPETTPDRSVRAAQPEPGDDFFCLRFGLWYDSYDCAFRTRFDTCPACRRCSQGRFNLERHRAALRPSRRLAALLEAAGVAPPAPRRR